MTTIKPKLSGWKKEGPKDDDYVYSGFGPVAIAEASSDVIDLRKWCPTVEDQSSIGSCVGNSVVSALEILNIKNGHQHVDLSRMFIYYNSRLMHSAADKDEGTYIKLAIGTLSSLGTCSEKKWPYDPTKVCIRPSWGAYREAYGHKIGKYYTIRGAGKDRIDAIISALSSGYPVVFGMSLNESFVNTGSDGMSEFYGPHIGGHAMLIVGVIERSKKLIVRNSWGEHWGDRGYCYIPYGVLDDNDANDFWVCEESPEMKR